MYVTTEIIFDLENVWHYINELKYRSDNYKDFADTILANREVAKYKGIVSLFRNCKAQLNGMIDLYTELTRKEEAKKKQIFEIYANSEFRIIQEELDSFDVELKYLKS